MKIFTNPASHQILTTLVTSGLITENSINDERYNYFASIENIINCFKININKLLFK